MNATFPWQSPWSAIRLRGAGLWLARAFWLALMIGTLGLFGNGLPLRFEDLRQRYQPQLGLTVSLNRAGQPALSAWAG